MPRLRQVPRAEVDSPDMKAAYDRLFGPDRDPVGRPERPLAPPELGGRSLHWSQTPWNMPSRALRSSQTRAACCPQSCASLVRPAPDGFGAVDESFSQHCKSCRAAGIAEERMAAIPSWQISDAFSPVERALLAYTDALVADGGRVPDSVFDALKAHLTDEQILEFTYTTCMYLMHATMSRAIRLEYDDRPEPVVEVPAPDGGVTGFDVGASISGS